MASGKSVVGPLLADRLGYRFLDLDERVERLAARPISEVFAAGGESAFRALEARANEELALAYAPLAGNPPTPGTEGSEGSGARPGVVIATGGGWMARPGLGLRWPGAVRVWLRVSPEAVLKRLGSEIRARPMIDPDAPERSIRSLLRAREPHYARAEIAVDTDGRTPREVAEEIDRRLRGLVSR
ncbi:MAG: shikimate kinase [Gemmatimonadota bacterium]